MLDLDYFALDERAVRALEDENLGTIRERLLAISRRFRLAHMRRLAELEVPNGTK
jgi:hypothetical protein